MAQDFPVPQPAEKGHLSVAFFSYRRRECGIMVWDDKMLAKKAEN